MKRRQGAVLVIVMALTILIMMFVGAATKVVPSALGLATATQRNRAAFRAAEAGMQYALARLRENPEWRGDGTGNVVSNPDLVVHEDRGNVIGVMRAEGGAEFNQFLIRFNHQDDAQGNRDGLANPTRWINHPYVSLNNMLGNRAVPLPRGDGPGWAVTAGSATPYSVPKHSVCLLVEGRSGPALRSINTAAEGVTYEPNWRDGALNRQVVESVVQIEDLDQMIEDAVTMSRKDSRFKLKSGGTTGKFEVVDAQTGAARGYTSVNGTVTTAGGFTANYDPSQVTLASETNGNFYQITWNRVRRADATSQVQLPAGTYVLRQSGELYYYNMNLPDYETYVKTNKTEPTSKPPSKRSRRPVFPTRSRPLTAPSIPAKNGDFQFATGY